MLVRLTSRIMDRGTERPVGALVEVAPDCSWVARGLAVEVEAEPAKPAPVAAPPVGSAPIELAPEPHPASPVEAATVVAASPPPASPRVGRRGRHAE